jgi:hypothetical protein
MQVMNEADSKEEGPYLSHSRRSRSDLLRKSLEGNQRND